MKWLVKERLTFSDTTLVTVMNDIKQQYSFSHGGILVQYNQAVTYMSASVPVFLFMQCLLT